MFNFARINLTKTMASSILFRVNGKKEWKSESLKVIKCRDLFQLLSCFTVFAFHSGSHYKNVTFFVIVAKYIAFLSISFHSKCFLFPPRLCRLHELDLFSHSHTCSYDLNFYSEMKRYTENRTVWHINLQSLLETGGLWLTL